MWHRSASTDRLSTHRSDARSPYAKNYRTNLTHDQREHLSHRQSISRLPRREFEDRYIALLDEYYALKKENAANNQKIKKMATKLLRLSAEGKSRGVPFPQQLAPNENLEIQIIRLEAYNSLLKDRLNAIIKKYSGCIQSTATSTMRRPASCSNLSVKRKIILSEDDLHLLEIPEPPTIVSKTDNRSSIGSGSAITTEPKISTTTTTAATKTMATNKVQQQHQHQHQHHHSTYQQSQSSIIFENDQLSNANEPIEMASFINGNSSINNLKNCIQKLQSDLNEAHESNDRLKRLNVALEEKITDQLIDKRTVENVELVELRRTMVECEMELHDLREQYLLLKAKAEHDLTKEHKKIDELTQIVKDEMDRNTNLSKDLQRLRHATSAIETAQSGKGNENASDSKYREELKTSGNDDLSDLLNEAKHTILELQREIEVQKSEIEHLRQQNQALVTTQMDSPRNQSNLKTDHEQPTNDHGGMDTKPPSVPLEPVVIVNDNKNDGPSNTNRNGNENLNPKPVPKNGREQMVNDQTSQSDSTYVVRKNKSRKQKKMPLKHIIPRTTYSTTDSEISSLDSDDQFRAFQNKNRKIQSSMILSSGNQQNVGMSFSQRMSLLEKVAYYRPLANVPSNANNHMVDQHRYLACDCKGFECDQQIEAFYEEIRRAVKNARAIMLQEIQNNPQMGGQHRDDITTATVAAAASSSFNKQFDDTSECREFLRVQYNLNNLYKQELELICKTCKQQRQELLKQIDMLKAKLQNYEDKLKSTGRLAGEMLDIEKTARMLYIDSNEGSFEFHITSFRPTKEGRPLLSCRHGELTSLYVSWHFFEHKFESKTSIRLPPNYTFESSHIYVVSIDKQFLMRLQNETVRINLFATAGSTNVLMGIVDINLAEVLLFPQNKIQLTTKVMSIITNDECEHTDRFCGCGITMAKPKHLGNLTIWFRLTCELDVLKSLFTDFDQWRSQTNHSAAPTVAAAATAESEADVDATVIGQHDEQQKKVSAAEQQSKNVEPTKSTTHYHDQPTIPEKNIITITIQCLKFNEKFQISTEDHDTQIHIECNFLGSRRLKTPSQPLARGIDQLKFDFTQAYPQNERNLQRLMNILKDPEHSIKFTLIETKVMPTTTGESLAPPPPPLPTLPEKSTVAITSDDESKHDCYEIGFGLLHFGKFVHELNSNSEISDTPHIFTIPILSKKPPYQNIGQLDVAIANIATLKSLQQLQN